MSWTPTSVVLTTNQKNLAKNETNTAKRLNVILTALMQNTDATFTEASDAINQNNTDLTAYVDQRIVDLKANLGTNFSVADIASRNALQGLSLGDISFVADDGDGKWAKYEVVDTTGGNTGDTVGWTKLLDQDMLVDVNINDMFTTINNRLDGLDQTVADNLATAKTYTDDQVSALNTSLRQYIDDQDNAVRSDLDPSLAAHLGTDTDWGL